MRVEVLYQGDSLRATSPGAAMTTLPGTLEVDQLPAVGDLIKFLTAMGPVRRWVIDSHYLVPAGSTAPVHTAVGCIVLAEAPAGEPLTALAAAIGESLDPDDRIGDAEAVLAMLHRHGWTVGPRPSPVE